MKPSYDTSGSNEPQRPSRRTKRRVTLKDIGEECGYHGTTVGLALRNHPSIPEATRKKIHATASRMGYHPDPALRALIAHRYEGREAKGFSTIAIISDHPGKADWRSGGYIGAEYYDGIMRRASVLGYAVEEFSVGAKRENEQSIERVLKTRGINAIIVAPLCNLEQPINLDWNTYSAVALGFSLISPQLPRITHQHRDGSQNAVLELLRLGYRRIAYLNPFITEVRVGYGYSAGFFGMVGLHADQVEAFSLIPQHYSNLASEESLGWVKRHQPEVIITSQAHLLPRLRKEGFRVPDDIGFVQLGVEKNSRQENQISGIYENSVTIGEEAVDLVAQMQISYRRGIPPIRQVHLVRGTWISGTTIRRVGDNALQS